MRARTIIILLAGAAVAGAIWISRGALSHKALGSVLENPAPTETAMNEFVGTAADPAEALTQLWNTGHIPAREFALTYLISHAKNNDALWQGTRPWVLAAATMADSEFQKSALQLFFDHKDEQLIPTAGAFLNSPDPGVRVLGLMRLNDLHDTKYAANFAAELDDSDPQVRTIAASALRNITGEDFGVRLSADTQASNEGLKEWKTWWSSHIDKYSAPTSFQSPVSASPGVPFDFTLPDLAGKPVSLGQFKGKVVLLNFWATWCPSCVAELQELGDLQRAHASDLVILGINLDGVSDTDDHDAPPDAAALAKMRPDIEKAVKDGKIDYPVLLDPYGKTLGPYGAGALPTSVLIGPDGTVKRRILGGRATAAWNDMIAQAASR